MSKKIYCIYCHSNVVKFGRDRNKHQRYRCVTCKKTFIDSTVQKLKVSKKKRLVLNLILLGCKVDAIAKYFNLKVGTIRKWKQTHLKGLDDIVLPSKTINLEAIVTALNFMLDNRNPRERHRPRKMSRSRWRR